MLNYESITKLTEDQLLRLVMENPRLRSHVLNCHDFPRQAEWRLAEPLTGLGDGRGDVDILAWNESCPGRALAVEAKLFKASVTGDDGDSVNKTREFNKAVVQANRLAKLGFALVYIIVFVLIDSRTQNAEAIEAGRHVYDGLTAQLRAFVEAAFRTVSTGNCQKLLKSAQARL